MATVFGDHRARHWRIVLILTLLALVPILGNWPVTSGWLTVDPLYLFSGLGTDLVAGPLPGPTGLDPNVGVTTQAMGRLAADEWLAGRVPWWNAYNGAGLPMSAEGQNQALFLPFVLLLALKHGSLLLLLALQEVTAFVTFALLRRIGLSRTAAWIGAALFALNGTYAWLGHGPMMPVAFAPMLLLGIEMEFRAATLGPTSRSWGWIVAAIAVAMSLYAGFPETAYLDALLGVAWSVLRLAQCPRPARIRLVARFASGALVGVLIAMPFIVPFAHMLSVANLGMHSSDIGAISGPRAALPMLVMPYLLGPQSFGWNDPSGVLVWLWDYLGGYVSAPVVFLAILALVIPPKRGHAERWVLAAWCFLMIGASYGVPVVTRMVYAFPALAQTQVFRYSPPSWELAAIMLAACAVDDWQRKGVRAWRAVAALTIVVIALYFAVTGASVSIEYLRKNILHYEIWLTASLLGAVFITLASLTTIIGRPSQRRSIILASLLVGDAIALFSVPRLAGFRNAALDMAPVEFLRAHVGLQRLYSLGALLPNYSAFFQIASINADYLPTPLIWANYVGDALDRNSDRNAFTGNFQWPGMSQPDHIGQFIANVESYRDLAVRYIAVPAGESLQPRFQIQPLNFADQVVLKPGERLETVLPVDLAKDAVVKTISVLIGTYVGASDGELLITLCAGETCQTGRGDLAHAKDNQAFGVNFDTAVNVGSAKSVRIALEHAGGAKPVAVYRYMQPPGPGGAPALPQPAITLGLGGSHVPARQVFSDALMTIYELDYAKPYFDAPDGACRVLAVDRRRAVTDCASPSRLIRRELFFEGWRARVNDVPVPITRADPILQEVGVPAGVSVVDFDYRPPYATFSAAAFVMGLLILLFGTVRRFLVRETPFLG